MGVAQGKLALPTIPADTSVEGQSRGTGLRDGRAIRPPLRPASSTRACVRAVSDIAVLNLITGIVDIGKHDNGTLGIRAELRVHVPGWPATDVQKLIQEVNGQPSAMQSARLRTHVGSGPPVLLVMR